jgi:exopolysaccharide biosynthesis polyprenyl glycosylphosphotransferase
MSDPGAQPREHRPDPLTGAPPSPDTEGVRRQRAQRRPPWELRYIQLLAVLDAGAAAIGLGVAWLLAGETPDATLHVDAGVAVLIGIALVAVWLVTLWSSNAYEIRHLGIGFEEYKRVGYAAVRMFALVAIVAFLDGGDVGAGFVLVFLAVGVAVQLVQRRAARKGLHRLRAAGQCNRNVLVVGARREVRDLVEHLRSAPYAGLEVVAACLPPGVTAGPDELPVPVVGGVGDLVGTVADLGVDAVVIADSHTVDGEALRRLAWQLEDTGVQLIVAPAVTQVAGPRIVIRPIAGLPLLQVDEPELSGGERLVKELFDRVASLVLLVVLSSVFLVIACVVRAGSRGPVLYRQVRVGRHGREFTMYKFRTMVAGADARIDDVAHLDQADGVLFKIHADPRVTRAGRFLRRHSLDELPQLWNVLRGQMSIVGPRPPLPTEVQQYGSDAQRRLLVKPGMSGLWQVSGRSELSWEESIRLDLYYVENWSPALDAQILWRTVGAVVKGRGAY